MDELRGSPECEHSHDSDSPFIFRLHKIEAGSKDTEDVIVSFEPSSAAA